MPLSNLRRITALSAVATLAVALGACSSSSSKAADPAPASKAASGLATTTTGAPKKAPGPSAGCRASSAIAPGQTTVHLQSSGADRWYLRHVPPSYDGTKPMPLVLDVHGYQEGANVHSAMTQLGAFGDDKGFITVQPNGLGTVPHWDTSLGSPDVKLMGDVLDDVEKVACIDTSRVYVTGLSQGAFMTSAVACAYADRIAAAAPVAGITANIEDCRPARPVPVIAFHGTNDTFVSYDGGLGEGALNLPTPDGKGKLKDVKGIQNAARSPSVPQHLAAWAKRNGCTLTLQEKKVTSDTTLLSYPCPKGQEVELYRVTGGGHSWPGSAFSASPAVASVVGKTTMTINADDLMWAFFQQHHL